MQGSLVLVVDGYLLSGILANNGSGGGGGMSDFVCVDRGFVHKLPDNVPLDVGGA